MKLREDEVIRQDGSVGVYGVVEKADYALVIPFENHGFYIVEQYRYPVAGRYSEFPQGAWEENPAASPHEVAVRELGEETGLTAGSLTHLGRLFQAYGFSTHAFDVFLARDLSPGATLGPSSEEQDLESRWVSASEFVDLLRQGQVMDAPTVASLALLRLHEPWADELLRDS